MGMDTTKRKVVYVIGALKNTEIPLIGKQIRELGFEVFDDWFSPGPEADNFWRDFEKARGSTHQEALNNYAAKHIFEFDKFHIDRADIVVLVMPAGKSGHLELGYAIGRGKKGFILFDEEPEKWDIMHQFADGICYSFDELATELEKLK